MKICIDTRSPGRTGVLSYMERLLKSLFRIDDKNEYILIIDSKHGSWGYEGVDEILVPSLNPFHWMAWSNTILPGLLKKKGVGIYHSLKHITAFRIKAKKIVTLHGVHQHYIMPEIFNWNESLYWKCVTYMAAKSYDRIITVADAEKKYLVENLGYPERRFRTVYLAGDERFRPLTDQQKLIHVKEKLDLPDNFILYVGMIHPRKNLEGLINGFKGAKTHLDNDYKLVIAGNKQNAYFQKIRNMVQDSGLEKDVLFTGYVLDEDLPCLYTLADVFLFPSHHEGFGIVLLEAMACGLPVITSNIEDICEVVGEAAVTINPANVSEISKAIVYILNSNELRQSLSEQALERSKMFSWDRCARETIKVYEEFA